MHAGNMLSGMLAWLSARAKDGAFVVRLEDLDDRCKNRAYAEQVLEDLSWIGMDWDEDPIVQSSGDGSRYDTAFRTLEERGLVYPCFCSRADLHAASAPHASDGTPLYAGTCRGMDRRQVEEKTRDLVERTGHGPAWRLAVADEDVAFRDALQGQVGYNLLRESGDFVVRRGDGVYAYQLAVVVDDGASGVTEVVRGSDLLSSAARQMYLQELLGLAHVSYAHHPLLLAPDGRRLSKRDKDCDMGFIRAQARYPEAFVGKLAHLVGMTDSDAPVSLAELRGGFRWDTVNPEDVKLTPCFEFF